MAQEYNFDGIVGPTHNYAGLSYGNIASAAHKHQVANPRGAALEGLAKMKLLAGLGVGQAVLPPQERPDLPALRRLGFSGSDVQVLDKARREDPVLLASVASASSMWAANAATVAPSADSGDGAVHFTPANLVSQLHRSLEPQTTAAALRALFPVQAGFVHHPPLPGGQHFGDEGAANHTRLCAAFGQQGIQLFVYGRSALDPGGAGPRRFPARQTLEAAQAIARMHRLDPGGVVFAEQSPAAIDAGVFHNDVSAVGNQDVFLYHAQAYSNTPALIDELRRRFAATCGAELQALAVAPEELSLAEAVETYFFNSQLVTLPGDPGRMALLAPLECRERASTRALVDRLTSSGPIKEVHYAQVRQSMHNGGGPACLRLRVVLTDEQRRAAHPPVFWSEHLERDLTAWVQRHYRDRLTPDDLADPMLLEESRHALDQLTQILGLPALYPFQQA